MDFIRQQLDRPRFGFMVAAALLLGTALLVLAFPRSVLAFLAFIVAIALGMTTVRDPRSNLLLTAVAVVVLLPLLGLKNQFYFEVATQVGIYMALALGLNVVVGFAGLLDLGYVAFYASGAYLYAIFASPQVGEFWPFLKEGLSGAWFWPFLAAAIGLAALVGVLLGLPVLRLRGDYLAIVTLGFGEIIRIVLNNLNKPVNITNGPQGITPIRAPQIFGETFGQPIHYYFIALGFVALVVIATRRLEHSRIGRAWAAIREDEIAARASGIPLVKAKLLAFATGASFAGAMGVVFAAKQKFVDPSSFSFMESIGVLAMVILGGMGSVRGALIGAAAVTVLQLQLLKAFSEYSRTVLNLPTQLDPAKFERLVFGVILILMMIFRPEGIVPSRRPRRELPGKAGLPTTGAGVGTVPSVPGEGD